jgi:hypothetical protein
MLAAAAMTGLVTQASAVPPGIIRSHPSPSRTLTAPAALYRAETAALAAARHAGRPVVVPARTTDVSQTLANPNGSFTTTTFALPVRVRQHGTWQTASAALTHAPNGTWAPAAAVSGLALSGGGTGPLATFASQDGKRMSLSFPVRLPRPTASGATLTYHSVWPGTDLRVTATTLGGITEELILRNKLAASNPALRDLRQPVRATGMAVSAASSGGLRVTAPGGRVEFTATRPFLWTPAPAASRRAATYAGGIPGSATMRISRGAVSIVPSPAALASAQAYPAHLAMSVSASPANCGTIDNQNESCGGSPEGFDEVQAGCPTYQNWDDVLGATGYTGNGTGYSPNGYACAGADRSFYNFNTSGLNSAMQVTDATLTAWVNYGADFGCNDKYNITLKWVNGISSSTDWDTQPGVNPGNQDRTTSTGPGPNPSSTCPQRTIQFNVTYAMKLAASGNTDMWTFGFYGDENSADNGFMRIGDNPNIVTTFDIIPPQPTDFTTTPASHDTPGGPADYGCSGTTPWINATDIRDGASDMQLHAHITAAVNGEAVRAYFAASDWGTGATYTPSPSAWLTAPSGDAPGSGTASTQINFTLQDGHSYAWTARAEVSGIPTGSDGPYYSPQSAGSVVPYTCFFNVDTTPPASPNVTSTAFPPSGSGATGQDAGTSGTFSFKSTDPVPSCSGCLASGVYGFEYSLNTPLPSSYPALSCTSTGGTVRADSAGGATSCPVAVGDWGTNTMYVAAIDTAGNISQTYQYSFYAPWNPATKVQPGDVTGDGVPDLLGTSSSTNDLLLLPGGTDPAGAPLDANNGGTTGGCTSQAPCTPDGTSWNTYQVAHRGSMTQQGVDDLFAHKGSNLYIYPNNPDSPGTLPQFGATSYSRRVTIASRPACSAPSDDTSMCAATNYYPADWSKVTNIAAPGDAWNPTPGTAGSASSADNGYPSLLTVEDMTAEGGQNGELWLFQGEPGPGLRLQSPVLLGSSGWNNVSVLAPGIVNGRLTIWAYDYSTGNLYSYPVSIVNGLPSLSANGQPITPTSGTPLLTYKPASGSAPAVAAYEPGTNYPGVYFATSPGSADPNGGTCANGCLWYLRGTSSSTAPLDPAPIYAGPLHQPISQFG